jgi:tetraacyldisaccharide 4'-kinase
VAVAVEGLYRGNERLEAEKIGPVAVAFAGIAKPERFFAVLEKMGIQPRRRMRFRDHHAFTPDDVAALGPGTAITTEKDAVRLGEIGLSGLLHVRIDAHITELDRLMDLIRNRIAGRP